MGTFLRSPGQQLAVIAGLIATVLVVYHQSVVTMVDLWDTQSYRHSYLIPVISAYVLWIDRDRLADSAWTGAWWALLGLVAGSWLWWLAKASSVQSLEHVAVFILMQCFVLSFLGLETYRRVAFGLLFLVFAFPVGREIEPLLMEITATTSSAYLKLVGIPVFREGMFLTLPGGNFEVAEFCSGYNYLNSGVALCSLLAYLVVQRPKRAVPFVAFAIVLFIFVNGVRAFIIMVIASATQMRHMVGHDHVVFGWVLFFLTMVFMYWLANRLSRVPNAA